MFSFFRGWWVVTALIFVLISSSGLGFYTLPILLRVLSEEGRFTIHTISFASGIFFIVTGLAGIIVARLLERIDVRIVITLGSIICAISLLALGKVSTRLELYAVYAMFGFGFAATSLVPAMAVVTRWFSHNRSVAVSLVAMGLSLGGVLIAPVSARFAEIHGINTVTPWLAAAYLIGTLPLTWLFVRDKPSDLGLRPDGVNPASNKTRDQDEDRGTPYSSAVRSRLFILLAIAYVLVMTGQVGSMMHIYNFVSAEVDPSFGQLCIATLSLSSILGRLGGGFILKIMSTRSLGGILIASNTISLLLFSSLQSPLLLLITVFIFGISVGNLIMIQALILADAFGVKSYGRIYALAQLTNALGYMAGPEIMGASFSYFGGYGEAFVFASLCSGLGLIFFFFAGIHSSSELFVKHKQ